MSYYVMPSAPIGTRELKSKTTGICHIFRSCSHAILVGLLNKELRWQYDGILNFVCGIMNYVFDYE